jgi:hypothetical protein
VIVVECRVPDALRVERARRRAARPDRVSDATAAVAAAQSMEPLDEIPPGDHIVLRADVPVEDLAAAVAESLDRRLLAGG